VSRPTEQIRSRQARTAGRDATAAPPAVRSAQPAGLRQQNLSSIMRAVMAHGPVARVDLAAITGMATGTITKLTAELAEAGLLREQEQDTVANTHPGRPRVPVTIDERTHRVVGIHIGLVRTNLGLVDLTGRLVAQLTLPHRRRGFEAVVGQAVDGVHQLVAGHTEAVIGVGASIGGWVDAQGRVREHPVLGWRDVPLRDALYDALSAPTSVDSSFRALVLAERWLGAASGLRHLVHLFVGNVVGAGLLLDGNVYRGASSAAGALDHLPVDGRAEQRCHCGRYDCLHVVAGDLAVLSVARAEGLVPARGTVDHLIAAAREGNTRAHELLARRARQVGTAAGTLIEVLDPQMIVIGGGVVDAPEYLEFVRDGCRRYLADKRPVDVDSLVRASSFGTHDISVSSAAVLLDEVYRDPAGYVPALRELRYG
jgi:predicted NBD/HSP70 family sugar kinase